MSQSVGLRPQFALVRSRLSPPRPTTTSTCADPTGAEQTGSHSVLCTKRHEELIKWLDFRVTSWLRWYRRNQSPGRGASIAVPARFRFARDARRRVRLPTGVSCHHVPPHWFFTGDEGDRVGPHSPQQLAPLASRGTPSPAGNFGVRVQRRQRVPSSETLDQSFRRGSAVNCLLHFSQEVFRCLPNGSTLLTAK